MTQQEINQWRQEGFDANDHDAAHRAARVMPNGAQIRVWMDQQLISLGRVNTDLPGAIQWD